MAVFETWLKNDLKKPVSVKQLSGNLFSADNGGNLIGVEVTDDGSPASLSGSVYGYVIRADGATVVVEGTLSENKASITLPTFCYVVVGQISIVIKVGSTTVGACVGYVYRTTTDTIVDPGHVIPSLEELLAQIATMQQLNQTVTNQEAGRVSAESGRVSAERGRASAETARASAETARASAENARASAETARASAETGRATAETGRVNAESSRVSAETARDTAETARGTAEAARAAAETARATAETARETAETARVSAETARAAAEIARTAAETQRATDTAAAIAAAGSATNAANTAAGKIDNMTATASGLPAGASPTVSVTEDETDHHKIVAFGIPKGDRGATGATPNIAIGTVTTLPPNQSAYVQRDQSSTSEEPVFNFGIPRGMSGNDDIDNMTATASGLPAGASPTVSVTEDETDHHKIVAFGIPKGDRGATGATPNIAIGTVTTLPPNQSAYVQRDQSSTSEEPVFNFGIPRGMSGNDDIDNMTATLDTLFGAMVDGTNTTKLFREWWPLARAQDIEAAALEVGASDAGTVANRYHTLCRWFTLLGKAWAGKYYTLRGPYYRVNSTGVTSLTPMGDLAGRVAAACATEESGLDPDWADEDPTTWYLRFNGLSLADGTMNVLAVEGVDPTFDITGNTAPVYTGRLGLFKLHYTDGVYEYKTFTTQPEGAFKPWAGDVAPDKTHRPMNWEATFPGSKHGTKLTSGSGYDGLSWERNSNTPAWRVSAGDGLSAARNWDSYEGVYSDTDLEPIIDLFQLRHFNLENSGIIEGCLNYSYQYVVSAAEEGVTSVLLTPAQAANLMIGGCVEVGSHPKGTNNDRSTAANYDLISCANILRMEDVTIDGKALVRVHLDIAAAVNIPATAYVSTMPWTPGSTEHLPGHKDGALYSCTAKKTPARIAGVEIIDGAYTVGLDPLWMSDYNAGRNPNSIYTVYQCRDSENQAGSITANYEEVGTFSCPAPGWQYEKHLAINDKGMIYPDALGASSATFMKSAFYFDASSGVRCPWRFMYLDSGGAGGLAGAGGHSAPGDAYWGGRPRLSGSGKKRGEWAA